MNTMYWPIDELDVPTDPETCLSCKHLRAAVVSGEVVSVCSAFSEGIPQIIRDGKHDHRKPIDGDHGIQYEKADN